METLFILILSVKYKSYSKYNDTDKSYLSLLGPLTVMYVIDVILDSFSNLFRSHRYSHFEKVYSVILSTAGLNLRF
jgi:hypothetical protein